MSLSQFPYETILKSKLPLLYCQFQRFISPFFDTYNNICMRNEMLHSLNETPVLGSSTPVFGCETKTGVALILVIFEDRPMLSHIIQKVSARAFH